MSHTDANIQPQGNPWDQNEPNWSEPMALPTDEQVALVANPLRPYLEALARDLLAGMATLNWQPDNLYVKGEVAAMKRALARALEHSYGLSYTDAFGMVARGAKTAIKGVKIGPEWDASKERRVAGLLQLLLDEPV